MAHAEHEFALSRPVEGDPFGSSYRETYQVGARNGDANAIARLEGPPLPESLAYLWSWYLELRAMQHVGMNGVDPLDNAELRAWQQNTDRTLEPWEFSTIVALDNLARRTMSGDNKKKMVAPPSVERAKGRGRG